MGAKPKAADDVAQAGGGDPRVVAHPGFRKMPVCLFALTTREGQKRYDDLARTLYDAGRMTSTVHGWLSSYAMQFDRITSAAQETPPRLVRSSAISEMNKAFGKLPLDDLDKPIAAPKDAPVNKFALAGFANRSRPDIRAD
jgi:hypothetical protein